MPAAHQYRWEPPQPRSWAEGQKMQRKGAAGPGLDQSPSDVWTGGGLFPPASPSAASLSRRYFSPVGAVDLQQRLQVVVSVFTFWLST